MLLLYLVKTNEDKLLLLLLLFLLYYYYYYDYYFYLLLLCFWWPPSPYSKSVTLIFKMATHLCHLNRNIDLNKIYSDQLLFLLLMLFLRIIVLNLSIVWKQCLILGCMNMLGQFSTDRDFYEMLWLHFYGWDPYPLL